MSAYNPLLDLSDQLCYVQCSFCNTILLVSVPCSSFMKSAVTVRCGHCQGLLSVNMGRDTFVSLKLLASLHENEMCYLQKKDEGNNNVRPSEPFSGMGSFSPSISTNGEEEKEEEEEEEEDDDDDEDGNEERIPITVLVNKPPEKRQRAPSAYNRFIKEEIKRIKAGHPNISHKEAFSSAAKNWAHFPRIRQKEDGESCSLRMGKIRCVDNKVFK